MRPEDLELSVYDEILAELLALAGSPSGSDRVVAIMRACSWLSEVLESYGFAPPKGDLGSALENAATAGRLVFSRELRTALGHRNDCAHPGEGFTIEERRATFAVRCFGDAIRELITRPRPIEGTAWHRRLQAAASALGRRTNDDSDVGPSQSQAKQAVREADVGQASPEDVARATEEFEEAMRLLEAGDPASAEKRFYRASCLNPLAVEAHYWRGVCAARGARSLRAGPRLDAWACAARAFESALRVNPGYWDAYVGLAETNLNRESTIGAGALRNAELFGALASMTPDDPKVHFELGSALSLIPGREGEAIVQFSTARSLGLQSAELEFRVGLILLQIGLRQPAREQYDRLRGVTRIGPPNFTISSAWIANSPRRRPLHG